MAIRADISCCHCRCILLSQRGIVIRSLLLLPLAHHHWRSARVRSFGGLLRAINSSIIINAVINLRATPLLTILRLHWGNTLRLANALPHIAIIVMPFVSYCQLNTTRCWASAVIVVAHAIRHDAATFCHATRCRRHTTANNTYAIFYSMLIHLQTLLLPDIIRLHYITHWYAAIYYIRHIRCGLLYTLLPVTLRLIIIITLRHTVTIYIRAPCHYFSRHYCHIVCILLALSLAVRSYYLLRLHHHCHYYHASWLMQYYYAALLPRHFSGVCCTPT